MKALSIRAPWWWFILHGGKDIENRDLPTKFRGKIYVHASRFFNLGDITIDSQFAAGIARGNGHAGAEFTYRQLKESGGCIVGTVDIVDCVKSSDSPWFFGDYGFVLANPVALKMPIPFKGALGFFEVPDEITSYPTDAL